MKPYLKAQEIRLSEMQDRRRRLTERQREMIREEYAAGNTSHMKLAKKYGVSKSLITIILNPERARKVGERMKAHWKGYARAYGRAYHAKAVRSLRNYKYRLFKAGDLKERG